MNRTLSERFRTQRTDRIRVDGFEVFSMTDLVLDGFSALEIIVESARTDVEQSVCLRSRSRDLRLVSDGGRSLEPAEDARVELLRLDAPAPARAEVHGPDESNSVIQVWNSWVVGGTDHAWTGNAAMVVEPLPTPPGATLRKRLWCSDGLGAATFEDLVVLLTVGPRVLDT